MSELTLKGPPVVTRPVAYSFRFEPYGGWAIFTLNEDTGELSVQSDWGNYSHRWNTGALGDGVKLAEFLAGCARDVEYLASKLQLSSKSTCLEPVVDDEATTADLRQMICEQRRSRDLSKDKARDLWEEAGDLVQYNWSLDQASAEFMELIDYSSFLVKRPSTRFKFLRDELLPFFCRWLRENVVEKAADSQAVAT